MGGGWGAGRDDQGKNERRKRPREKLIWGESSGELPGMTCPRGEMP